MGTFTVISQSTPPVYTASGTFGTTDSCQASYPSYVYATWPLKRDLLISLGTGPSSNRLLATYVGDPFKYINIISFTSTLIPSNTNSPLAGKLYYLGTEVTSFPFQVDIEGMTAGTSSGFELGQQLQPLCTPGEGHSFKVTFTVTDINGNTGVPIIYQVQTTYNP